MKRAFFICFAFLSMTTSCSEPEYVIEVPKEKPKPRELVGTVYHIAHRGITDHSNAAIRNSIAWYFATYGRKNTYILTAPDTIYGLGNLLTVPDSSILM